MAKFILSAFADEADKSLDLQIEALKKNGIEYVELRNIDGRGVIDYLEDEDGEATLKGFKAKLDENGIKVSAIGSPIGKVNLCDDFALHIKKFENTIKAAKIFDTKRIRMFSFYKNEDEAWEDRRELVLERLQALIDMANKAGVWCCHENEKGIYGDVFDRVLDLHKSLGADLKGIFDPSNYIQCGEKPGEIFDDFLPYLDYMHIKDALLEDGSVVPAGYGDGAIKNILQRLNEDDREIILTLEPHLTVFPGFENLNDSHTQHKFTYSSAGEAFDAAVKALKDILGEL